MKKYIVIAFSVLLCLHASFVQAQQQFQWVKGGGSPEVMPSGALEESVQYMCTDPNGNVYALSIVGGSTGTPIKADTFYKSSGAYGNPNNILLTSYTCAGVMRWAKLIAATDQTIPDGIVADNLGHVYVSGSFRHTAAAHALHIGNDTTITTDIYLSVGVIQLDTLGHFNWIRFVGENKFLSIIDPVHAPLVLDGANNIHYLPYIKSRMALMPGDTTTYGVYDMTYNPSGTLLSGIRLDMDSQWFLRDAVIDPITNKLYVSGEINQNIFGGYLTDTFYAAAFDVPRHKKWQYFCGGNGDITNIALDQSKHLYFSGASSGTAFSFNGSSVPAGNLLIVLKTDTNGSVSWIKRYTCTTGIFGFNAIKALPNNKVGVFGTFAGAVTDGITTLTTPPGEGPGPFLVILDSGMNVQTTQQIHGNATRNGSNAITCDKIGNIYLGGQVEDSIWTTSPKLPAYRSTGGNTDFFVIKYGVTCNCTAMPVSMFSNSGTHTLSVSYTGTTAGLDSVVWNFGDGSASVKGSPASHTYTVAGTYRVTVIVYTTCGNDIYGKDVVIVCGAPPVAAFTNFGIHPLNVTYTGTISTVDSVVWSFGDGGRAKGSSASHSYAVAGTYTVCCTAYSICGNNTTCKTIIIPCATVPVASFTSTGTYSLATTYTGTAVALDSVVWSFGDGGRATGTTAAHSYSAIGTYTVCVTAYSPCGSNSSCSVISVPCLSTPVAAYTGAGHDTLTVNYTGTSAGIDSVVWDFGDGTSTVTGTPATHTYIAVGTYHVCVTAYSPCGNNTFCTDDIVRCLKAPVASFTDTGKKTMGFNYTGTMIGMDSVVWNFGDGATARGLIAAHGYKISGTYDVCVTVYTSCGADSACKKISGHGLAVPIIIEGEIKVFPNPANDELTITGIEQRTSYRLLSVSGVTIQSGIMERGVNMLSVKKLVPAVYVLELTGEDGSRKMIQVVKD